MPDAAGILRNPPALPMTDAAACRRLRQMREFQDPLTVGNEIPCWAVDQISHLLEWINGKWERNRWDSSRLLYAPQRASRAGRWSRYSSARRRRAFPIAQNADLRGTERHRTATAIMGIRRR